MSGYSKQRRDGNEDEIEAAFKAAGGWCQHMPREVGFDDLVHAIFFFPFPAEIKQPKADLTALERGTRQRILEAGGIYVVLRFALQAESLILLARDACAFGWSLTVIRDDILKMELV